MEYKGGQDMFQLGCLFTFITALAKVFGIINISWLLVLAPVAIPIALTLIIFIVSFVITLILDK